MNCPLPCFAAQVLETLQANITPPYNRSVPSFQLWSYLRTAGKLSVFFLLVLLESERQLLVVVSSENDFCASQFIGGCVAIRTIAHQEPGSITAQPRVMFEFSGVGCGGQHG